MFIRQATENDAPALCCLYANHLTASPPPEKQDMALWRKKLSSFDNNYHIFVLESDEKIVSSVTLVIIENLTHNLRPYALIENVVTHSGYRNKGLASRLLRHASVTARQAGCYKIMLLTGSKLEATLKFYRQNGFNSEDKTGFVMWL